MSFTWRRRRVARYAVVVLGLALVGSVYAAITGAGRSSAATVPPSQQQQIARGQQIFQVTCGTCHGMQAQGTPGVAPSLVGAGSAAVYFQVSTGRMPLREQGAEADRKPSQLTPQQTLWVAEYIQSLGGGPQIPTPAQVSTSGADVALGQELFTADCAQCHNFDGAGGALTDGKYGPSLNASTPTQIYTAMLTGPEAMPVFDNTTITPASKRAIIAYVVNSRNTPNPGGFSLGRVGPVTEGLVAFLGLLFAMVLAAMWITAKHRKTSDE